MTDLNSENSILNLWIFYTENLLTRNLSKELNIKDNTRKIETKRKVLVKKIK